MNLGARTWDGHETDVLMPQRYGDRPEWERHFEYLLSFFKDQYYEKIDNKPVLVLYRCTSIPKCEEMIACWNQLCKQNGFDGIYIIEEKTLSKTNLFVKIPTLTCTLNRVIRSILAERNLNMPAIKLLQLLSI